MSIINPERIVAKFDSARTETEDAQFLERVWFLQAMSMQAGGLDAFVATLISQQPNDFQTAAMTAAGQPAENGCYSKAQCLAVWNDFSRRIDPFLQMMARDQDLPNHVAEAANLSFHDFTLYFIGGETTPADFDRSDFQGAALRSAFERFNYAWLRENCSRLAKENLPRLLADYCQEPHVKNLAPIYCPKLKTLLEVAAKNHAAHVKASLVETVVTQTVWRELEFAWSECVPVPIVGESRFGKTTSVAKFCEAFPGRARLVTVPENNREIEFLHAHADAIGIAYTTATSCGVLKSKVEQVIRCSGLMLVYDEAHYLIPTSYHKATPPRRLNWVRAQVIDKSVPCAFFATPQSYKQTLDKYVATTGYRIEQWLGRMSPAVILSDVIPFEQIVAIARQHFPEIPEVLLGEIADRAILSDGHLKSVELAGRRARFLARERGHAIPTKQDVMDAIEAMMPTSPRVVSHAPEQVVEIVSQPDRGSGPAGRRQVAPTTDKKDQEFPSRITKPARSEPITV